MNEFPEKGEKCLAIKVNFKCDHIAIKTMGGLDVTQRANGCYCCETEQHLTETTFVEI